MKLGLSLLAAAVCTLASPLAMAAVSPFSTVITVDDNTVLSQGYSNITDLLNTFTNKSLATFDPNNLPATASINLRGLTGVTLSYNPITPSGQTQLTLSIPALGINQPFTGSNLDQSQASLKSFFEGQGGKALVTRIFNALAASSPIDPVVGNPGSLMSSMEAASFSAGNTGVTTDSGVAASVNGMGVAEAGTPQNFLALETHFGSYTQHGNDTQIVSLPLSYTHDFSRPGYSLTFDMPLTYMKSDGAQSGAVSLGASLRVPVAERWTLTPMLRTGAAGSEDLGTAGVVYSGGLMSDYRFLPVGPVNVGLLDMVSYFKTGSIKIGSYDVGYDLKNVVYRNGLDFSGDTGYLIHNAPTTWSAQVVRTDFTGDQLFCRYSNDFSVSVGTRQRKGQVLWNSLRVGLTYTHAGEDIRGFGVNMGYTF